jgi:hypothetical protein
MQFHLLLGYKYNLEMPSPELVQEVGRKIRDTLGESFRLELPKFYKYESVDEFEPM